MEPEPTKSGPRTPVTVSFNQELYVTDLQTTLEIDSVHLGSFCLHRGRIFLDVLLRSGTTMHLRMRYATPSEYLDLCEEYVEHDRAKRLPRRLQL